MRVLVAEDDPQIGDMLARGLREHSYAVDLVVDGQDAIRLATLNTYDAMIIDVMLPKRDGFSVARTLRSQGVTAPMLMLTARDAIADRVAGLDAGADDYLVKPFVENELIARLRALLRRADRPPVSTIDVGPLHVDVGARWASFDGKPIELGSTEFRLLELLARNAGIALSRPQVLERIWDYDFDGSSNIVDVYVSQLRRKLKKLGGQGIIETVWGVGYRLRN